MPESSDDALMQSVARNEEGAFRTLMQAFQLDQIQKYSMVMVDFTNSMLNGWRAGETRVSNSEQRYQFFSQFKTIP